MPEQSSTARIFTWLGLALIAAGFFGHYFAAQAIGGHYIAYRDHMFGFTMLALLTTGIVALLGRKFWKGRPDISLLIIGLVQALMGFYVYIQRFHIA